jgi:Uncharacterized protein conserved in bacteria (DUF2147)
MRVAAIAIRARGEKPLIVQWTKPALAGFIGLLLALFATMQPLAAQEPSVVGLWQKVNPETGKSVVWFLFVENNGAYEGVAAKLFPRPTDDPGEAICRRCQDDRKDAPTLGLPIIRGMQRTGLRYEHGNILDPRDGNIYNAMMTVSPDGQTLTVRGYLAFEFLGRNEVWYRLPDTAYKDLDPVIVAKYLPGQMTTSAMRRPARPNNQVR